MTHMLEVSIDLLAEKLGMDPLEVRRKNFIAAGALPVHDALRHHVRLGRLRDRAGQGARDARPRRVPRRAGRAARAGHPARRRLQHVHGDLRPRAVAGGRAEGLRPRHRPVRVRARARAPDGHGDGLHRRVAARPGPRDGLRADRRGPPRHRAGGRRGHPRRHGDRPDGPRHVRLALAGDRRRRVRARRGEARAEVHARSRRSTSRRRSTTSRSAAAGSRSSAIPTRP